ncbi:hypothetical protein PQQ75_25490 [Paraburkholderia aspalathi]|jgi:hypothetical protein|uniref:hypothetical protein n=1 Tax=Paraburkholderia aspalathi TaxID=1324617 RepID=UPI0038B72613
MTVSNSTYLKQIYDTAAAIGQKAISSDAMIEFAGFESMALLVQGFPWPVLTSGGEIEVPMPLGIAQQIPQQAKVNQQGAVTIQETVAGTASDLLLQMIAGGGRFDAKVYNGTTDQYRFYLNIKDCFLSCEPSERNWDNRGSIVTLSGTLFYHYFGEKVPGNIT